MGINHRMSRRTFCGAGAATVTALAFPIPAFAQAAARIVVIGGGFGGASCARALKAIDPKLQVTLVEPNKTFTACPFSNIVIAGLRSIEQQQFGYDKVAAGGVTVVAQAATAVDATARTVGLADGSVASLRPAGAVSRRRSAFRRAARLRRSRRREDAACLEGRRADAAAAQANSKPWRMAVWW